MKSKNEIDFEFIQSIQKSGLTQNIVLSLANDIYLGRGIQHKNIEYTKLFIENVLTSLNIKPFGRNGYRIPFTVKDSLRSDIIVAHIDNKAPNKTIVLIANYDHLGIVRNSLDYREDSIYNGANDNATGVAALFQLANMFKKYKVNYNFLFCFTSGKYQAMCGAGYLADTLRYYNLKPLMAINFEMLGKRVNDTTQAYILNDDLSNFRELMNQNIQEDFLIPIMDSTENESQNEKSEHTPFKNIFHIPSHTLTTFNYENDDNYLSPKDDKDNIDMENVHLLINKISYGLYKLFSNEQKLIYKGKYDY